MCRGKQTSVSQKEILKRTYEYIAKTNELILSPVGKILDLNSLECVLTRAIKSWTSKSNSKGMLPSTCNTGL